MFFLSGPRQVGKTTTVKTAVTDGNYFTWDNQNYRMHPFSVRPLFRNVPKTLRKQPKLYFWDWSMPGDKGARYENCIASHLLKAVHWWTDIGLGTYGLYYLRDKEKREADFLITKNDKPWFIVEVKSKQQARISSALPYFQSITNAGHAFQVMMEADYIERDCFEIRTPVQVPAATFLSQLV